MANNEEFYALVEKAMKLAEHPGTLFLLRAAHHHESVQSSVEVPAHLREVKSDWRPRRGVWAPGEYLCACIYCKEMFMGDKRAGSCADCAYKDAAPCGCDDPETCEDRDESCPPKGEGQT